MWSATRTLPRYACASAGLGAVGQFSATHAPALSAYRAEVERWTTCRWPGGKACLEGGQPPGPPSCASEVGQVTAGLVGDCAEVADDVMLGQKAVQPGRTAGPGDPDLAARRLRPGPQRAR